jgi:transposase
MESKYKYNKEEKQKACAEYHRGVSSLRTISKEVGCNAETIRKWYLKYTQYGLDAFNVSTSRKKYSEEFKLKVVKSYLIGNYTMSELSVKYKISASMVQRWVKKYNSCKDIENTITKEEIDTMKSRKTTYEERLEIVNWVISNQMDYKEAANRYSITYALIYKWTKAYLKDGEEALQYKKRGPKPPKPLKKQNLSEIERLKIELKEEQALRKRRELEIKILKKKEEFEKKLYYRK